MLGGYTKTRERPFFKTNALLKLYVDSQFEELAFQNALI